MKKALLLLLFCCLSMASIAQESVSIDTLSKTQYFTFHNNLWMNLHHFFYEMASQRQKAKLSEDHLEYKNIGDQARIEKLSPSDRDLVNQGIDFYKNNLIDQELLHSGRVLKWLQQQPLNTLITNTQYSEAFTNMLNQLKPVYEYHFWPTHRQENQLLLSTYQSLIEQTEKDVIQDMERASGKSWSGKVRVDLTTYGNWAGAYSPSNDNIVVASIDPQMHSSLFVEFVFHESSHLLFSRRCPFRTAIKEEATAMDLKPSRALWHAAMFYLSGIATQDALKAQNVDHVLIMEKKKVFSNHYQNQAFKAILNDYYQQNITTKTMAKQLLMTIQR